MTSEQLLIAFIFNALFFMQVGRLLTLHHQAKKTVEGIDALLKSPWICPQGLSADLLHPDQEAIEVPEFIPSLTLQCRLIHSSVKARAI